MALSLRPRVEATCTALAVPDLPCRVPCVTAQFEDPLRVVMREPARVAAFSGKQCTELLRQARFSGLTGRLAEKILRDPGFPLAHCPTALRMHLESALRVCHAQRAEVLREARFLDHALASLGAPVVLLKGAAYAVAGLPAANGRVFSDIDILVPKASLAKAESLLTLHGWMTTEASEYNQQYYRRWMHELPPMRHLQRGTVLDVHHTILPETARLRPDASKLIAAAKPLANTQVLHVLSPVDMLLHSMTHLFMNDDMTHALRDLSDLQLLLRGGDAADATWAELVPRAMELNLGRPLHYALTQLARVLNVDVPPGVLNSVAPLGPGPVVAPVMHWIWSQALSAPLPVKGYAARDAALWALYLRGHWLRMPPLMLLRHLAVKALGLHQKRKAEEQLPKPLQG